MDITKKQWNKIVGFILFMFVFTAILNLLTPLLYNKLPNDYVRTKLILTVLSDTLQKPDMVVFGNSRGMSGVDCNILGKKLNNQPLVYSLTSTGQQLSESVLYYSSLPASVKTVIQCVDIDQLSKPINMDIPNRVALHMYGYAMDKETHALLPSLYETLDYPDVIYNYEARSCLYNGLSTFLRNLLDDDVSANKIDKELFYPNSSVSDRNDRIYQRDIDEHNKENRFENYVITPEWKDLINNSYTYLQSKGIVYYLVLMPYNPDIVSYSRQDKQNALKQVVQEFQTIPLINCLDLLDATDFYDAIHPNRKGAGKITNKIIDLLP